MLSSSGVFEFLGLHFPIGFGRTHVLLSACQSTVVSLFSAFVGSSGQVVVSVHTRRGRDT